MKTSTSSLYCKLIGMRLFQALRLVGLLAFGVTAIAKAWEMINFYIDYKTMPTASDFIILAVAVIAVIVLSTLKAALQDKCSDYLSDLQHQRMMKQRKAELRFKYTDRLAEESIANESVPDKKPEPESGIGEILPIRKFDVKKITKEDAAELDKLIGLGSVKEQVKRIRATIAYEREHGGNMGAIPHMKFVGNPGTGKTSVAKAMAAILYDAGILRKPKYISVNGNELMGAYMGQTAPTINALFKQASGGLLFIDEAYTLASAVGSSGSGYGMEAVNQLLTHLEDPANETVVIFGGYAGAMDCFFDLNPGLRSRVPITLYFPDYSSDELLEILELNLRKKGHDLAPDTKSLLLDVFEQKMAICKQYQLPFSNGRYARNCADELHGQHAVNYMADATIGSTIAMPDINPNALINLD